MFIHQRGPALGELSFRIGGKFPHEQITDAKPQDGISQKLQPFIVLSRGRGIFVHVRTMGQGLVQKRQFRKPAAQLTLQTS